ncbi:MAG TPA: hypothetical protein VKX17_13245 [Planctomycetota bacterium]|nr:hypothetical protein [Planctomycetota bacterium]
MKTKIEIGIMAMVALLFTGMLIYKHYFAFPQNLIDLIKPEPSSAEDWRKIRFLNGGPKSSNLRYSIATNLKPAFQVENNTSVWHLKANNTLIGDEIITKVWGHKAHNSLEINWKTSTAAGLPSSELQGLEFNEVLDSSPSVIFGVDPKNRSVKCIGISKLNYSIIPYDYTGYSYLAAFTDSDSHLSVIPKISEVTRQLRSLIVVDTGKPKLLDEVELPAKAQTRPYFALDRKNGILIGIGMEVDWIIVIDLRSMNNKHS